MGSLAEFVNCLSERLTGCREGSEDEMLARVDDLVDLERTVALGRGSKRLAAAFDELRAALEEIEEDPAIATHPVIPESPGEEPNAD